MDKSPIKPETPIYKAIPQSDRRIIVSNREHRVSHPNLIPDDILKDEFLNTLITTSLPRNYNFEVHKTIWKIKQTNSKRILLQLPEGLIRFGPVLVDIIVAYFDQVDWHDIRVITMGDLTYGACCIDDYLARSLCCDLVVHYAHSCLIPINQINKDINYLYIFLEIKFDLEHVINCIKHNFDANIHRIALASTIQFISSAHNIARKLRESGYNVTLPQSRPLSSGEVLGCTAPKLDASITTILFICDGRFHLEALMIANPTIEAFLYNPYSRKLTLETYAFDEMYDQRINAIHKSVEAMRNGGTFGFILGTLGRQGNENVYNRMIERLKKYSNCKYIKFMMPEVVQETLKTFDSVDVWVQVACPRLSIDWGSFFHAPLLNPYEFAQCISLKLNCEPTKNSLSERNYPMDFYAKNSGYDHTPNHTCNNNSNCECSSLDL